MDDQEAAPTGSAGHSTSGLDPNLAGLLSYILTPITGVIFFIIEKSNAIIRFHAAQSIVFGVAATLLLFAMQFTRIVLTQISWTLGSLFGLLEILVWLGLLIAWIALLVKGYSGEKWKLPVLGDVAERLASS